MVGMKSDIIDFLNTMLTKVCRSHRYATHIQHPWPVHHLFRKSRALIHQSPNQVLILMQQR